MEDVNCSFMLKGVYSIIASKIPLIEDEFLHTCISSKPNYSSSRKSNAGRIT